MSSDPHYRVYVIRCWEEQSIPADATIYRFTLEVPGTGQRLGFTSSQALMDEIGRRLTEPVTEQPDTCLNDQTAESGVWQQFEDEEV
jgi:hypothetical protein